MEPAVVALLAAGIPAFVAAATFATTTIIGAVSSKRRARIDALAVVLDALEAVTTKVATPRVLAVWRKPELHVLYAVMRLAAILPKRDRIVWQWLSLRSEELAQAQGLKRVEIASEMEGVVISFISAPTKTRTNTRTQATNLNRPDRFF